jgi:predicted nucleotidyltransferase
MNKNKTMITESDKEIIQQYAKKYNVSSIILFGSSLEKNKKANDIDLGVKGIEPRLFFKFYAELFKHLSKPAHLIDLSKKSLFNDLVEETGEQIYGRSA